MRVLVTGSAGFIGRRIVEVLAARGDVVSGLDRRDAPLPPGAARQDACDILDSERLLSIVDEVSPEAIIHLAARTDLNEKSELAGYATNIAGVENLISAIRQTPSVKRCIFTSSQLVCRVGYVPRDELDYRPNTLYGQSKVLTEQIVRAENGGGIEWCLTRPTTVWGPGMSAHYQRLLAMIQNGRYFHVGGKPLHKSYSYIANIAHQYRMLLDAPAHQIVGRTYYLADYEPIELAAWTNAFRQAMQAPPIRKLPKSLAIALAWCGDVINLAGLKSFPFNSFRLKNILTEYTFDLQETEKVCGPLPYTMQEGVEETVAWFQASG